MPAAKQPVPDGFLPAHETLVFSVAERVVLQILPYSSSHLSLFCGFLLLYHEINFLSIHCRKSPRKSIFGFLRETLSEPSGRFATLSACDRYWMAHADKYPGLCTPDESYHGITYAERFGMEGAFITKCTAQLMRDLGCIQSPQNAYILNLGLESLHVRMPRHVENGLAVAEFLEQHPKVVSVTYPGLKSDKYYEIAQKYLPNGGCGVVSFELEGGRAAAEKFMKNLKLAAIETHVADARTCCLNPATSTHRQMTEE